MKNKTYKTLLEMIEQQQAMIECVNKCNNALKTYIEACISSQNFRNDEKNKYNNFKTFEDFN